MEIIKSFGRAEDNNVVIINNSVSKYHFKITLKTDGSFFLTDLNSTNGTFLNDKKIEGTTKISKGDSVRAAGEEVMWENYFLAEEQSQKADSLTSVSTTKHAVSKRNWGRISAYVLIAAILTGAGSYFLLQGNGNTFADKVILDKFIIPDSIRYDYDCYKESSDSPLDMFFDLGNSFRKEFNKQDYDKVTLEEEVKQGEDVLNEILKKNKVWENTEASNRCNQILDKLTQQIKRLKQPRGFKYKLTMLDTKEINAFTCGGQIIYTKAMYEFAKSDDEIACILSHEIAHNERGHLRKSIAELKAYGPLKVLQQLLAPRFDQFDEAESDMWGMDLAIRAKYDACANIDLWKRMKEKAKEGEYNPFENLFRSHPFSSVRSKCSAHHLKSNYQTDCKQ